MAQAGLFNSFDTAHQPSQDAGLELADDDADIVRETPADNVFISPSIKKSSILDGSSYAHYSPIPRQVEADLDAPCVLGVDEAGRGPVLGPMVYGVFYMPIGLEQQLLKEIHHFDDSKALTPTVRSRLMQTLATPSSDLHDACGWATHVMSARDIGAGMLRASATYNLNNQAMDATIELIKGVSAQGVNIREVYVDTIGRPETYQRKLEHIFPTMRITVAKKADSLYPCVSAASVCAKVTRDAALEVCYETHVDASINDTSTPGWGSGYPSDVRCSTWLKQNMDPLFGWGSECRFSWSTSKDLLETPDAPCKVDWPEDDDADDSMKLTSFYRSDGPSQTQSRGELGDWFGVPVTAQVF